jgi:hypothetical protein
MRVCGSCNNAFSNCAATASVLLKALPGGMYTSRINSERSELGKNCFFTTAMPSTHSTKAATTSPVTSQRRRTQVSTRLRSLW